MLGGDVQARAQRLASVLTSLGYEHLDSSATLPELLEWAFSVDATRPFLDWIVDSFEDAPGVVPRPRAGLDGCGDEGGWTKEERERGRYGFDVLKDEEWKA
ncbi:hypothetical protein HK101_004362, partial [Irineochytrium annulatum]